MSEHDTFTAGMDIGDKHSHICILDACGEILEETRIRTTKEGVRQYFSVRPGMRVALEAGTHSPWISRILEESEQQVVVANPRRLSLISENQSKNDVTDAELLARLARADPKLLAPVKHRTVEHQRVQSRLRGRDVLVRQRTMAINYVRATVKTHGSRLPKCSAESFHRHADALPEDLKELVAPVMAVIAFLTARIKEYDRIVRKLAEATPEATLLQTAPGVGPNTALAFVSRVETPDRFPVTRDVAPFLGIRPGRRQSGDSDPQRRITKTGDGYTRRLLVTSAQYILGPFGPDSALRQWGLALAERGGRNAKKRAVVAVARKLSVILLTMWKTGKAWEAFPQRPSKKQAA